MKLLEPTQQMLDRLNNMPDHLKRTYKMAMNGTRARKAARAFCLECCGYNLKAVRSCVDSGCPLYRFRLKCPRHAEKITGFYFDITQDKKRDNAQRRIKQAKRTIISAEQQLKNIGE